MNRPWNSDISFPSASNEWSAWRPPFGRRLHGESTVRRSLWQWHPLDPILVATPDASRMLPPVCFAELAPGLQHRMLRQYRLLLLLNTCMSLASLLAGVFLGDAFLVKASIALFLLLTFVLAQYGLVFRRISRLSDYARFCAWCHLQPVFSVVAISLLMVAAGSTQYLLQSRAGSLFGLMENYGLVFHVAMDQPWRYVTGPFLHAGLAHWVGNFSLLVVASGLAFALGRHFPVWLTFFAGALIPSFALTFLPHWIGSDAFLGLSGGIFALLGWIAGATLRARASLPFGLWGLVAYFAFATAVISSLLDARASWFVHFSGLGIGCTLGLLAIGLRPDIKKSGPEAQP